VRQVVLDLPPHALDLLPDLGGELGMPGGCGTLRFLRQYGERRLQPVGEVRRFADGPLNLLIPVVEQRVQIVDERLHFGGISPFHTTVDPRVDAGQPGAQVRDRREPAAHLHETGGRTEHCQQRQHEAVRIRDAVEEPRISRVVQHDGCGDDERRGEEAGRPEHRAEQEAGPERAQRHHVSCSMR
jgi:hypothetical protein